MPDEPTTVALTFEDVAAYLDGAIRSWRKRRDATKDDAEVMKAHAMAGHYVDAYQSVRSSLLGRTLPEETGD